MSWVSNLQQINYYTNCVPAGFNYNMVSNLLRINYYMNRSKRILGTINDSNLLH